MRAVLAITFLSWVAGAATIEGTIVDAGGAAVAGVRVEAKGARATSDGAGRFRLELEPGTYVLTFRHPDGGQVTQSVTVEDDLVKMTVTLDLGTEVVVIRQKAPPSQ